MWYNRALTVPAYHLMSVKTAVVMRRVRHIPGMKPRNFITVLPPLSRDAIHARVSRDTGSSLTYEKIISAMYVPFTRNIAALSEFYVIKTNERVTGIEPLTIFESVRDYHNHPEKKAQNGYSQGEMARKHVVVDTWLAQGKETSYSVLELVESTLPPELSDELIDMTYPPIEEWHALQEKIRAYGVNRLAHKIGLSNFTVSRLLTMAVPPDYPTLLKIQSALSNC